MDKIAVLIWLSRSKAASLWEGHVLIQNLVSVTEAISSLTKILMVIHSLHGRAMIAIFYFVSVCVFYVFMCVYVCVCIYICIELSLVNFSWLRFLIL